MSRLFHETGESGCLSCRHDYQSFSNSHATGLEILKDHCDGRIVLYFQPESFVVSFSTSPDDFVPSKDTTPYSNRSVHLTPEQEIQRGIEQDDGSFLPLFNQPQIDN